MVEEIKEFLRSKRGYTKEGHYRLFKTLKKKGYSCTPEDCKKALREFRNELKGKYKVYPLTPEECYKPIKRLFYDIETSYNIVTSWRVGYNINLQPESILHERAIMTIAWKWEGEDTVYVKHWNNGCDKELVEHFINLLNESDEVVTHNGERYDTPFIMTRALKHGILALPKYQSYDTLKKAKYHFNFNSNKLDYIAKFLGLEGKYKHSGMKMWDDIILYDLFKQGSKEQRDKSLKEMMYYNQMDVIQTEEVFNRLRLYTSPNVHHGVLLGKPKFTCPNDGSENVEFVKTIVTSAGTIKHIMQCNDCGQQFVISNKDYLKYLKQ